MSYRRFFFPPNIGPLRSLSEQRVNRKLKPNGGWSDKRDLDLCLLFQNDTHVDKLESYRQQVLFQITQFKKS